MKQELGPGGFVELSCVASVDQGCTFLIAISGPCTCLLWHVGGTYLTQQACVRHPHHVRYGRYLFRELEAHQSEHSGSQPNSTSDKYPATFQLPNPGTSNFVLCATYPSFHSDPPLPRDHGIPGRSPGSDPAKHVPDLHGQLSKAAQREPKRPEEPEPLYCDPLGCRVLFRPFQDHRRCTSRATAAAAGARSQRRSSTDTKSMEGP